MRVVLLSLALVLAACDEGKPPDQAATTPAESPTPAPAAEPIPVPKPPPEPAKQIIVEAPHQQATPAQPGVPRDALRYQRDLIGNARAVWGINAPVSTFAGQVHQESTWKADARSRTGAAGLAQFMPRTADWISGLYRDELGGNEPLNPAWALRALTRYDKHLYDRVRRFDSDCDRMKFALSDYNGGSGWRIKRQDRSPEPGNYETTSAINPGIAPGNQKENQEYALRIVYRWQPIYKAWGIGACAT
jgi:soluble lytic murein transglycosylase-like protein